MITIKLNQKKCLIFIVYLDILLILIYIKNNIRKQKQ